MTHFFEQSRGLLLNLILIYFLSSVTILTIVLIVNVSMLVLINKTIGNFQRMLYISLAILIVFSLIYFKFDEVITGYLYPHQNVLKKENSPYGQLVITEMDGMKNFYENGILKYNTQNVVEPEESIHYCLSQVPFAKRILVISGDLKSIFDELDKYPDVNKIFYLEMNPYFIPFAKEYINGYDSIITSNMLEVVYNDPRIFLAGTAEKFDAVITNNPDPATAHINRFYTVEFFNGVKKHLNEKGAFSLSISSAGNYMSREATHVHESIYNTLHQVFNHVLIIPGAKTYYLASDEALYLDKLNNINSLNITTKYVNDFYLDTNLIKMKADIIYDSFGEDNENINTDYRPVTYFLKINHWLKYFDINSSVLIWSLAGILLLVLILYSVVSFCVFSGGFTAASAEFVLIISFQIIYGYVYELIGLIVTVFMAGLAVGSLLLVRKINSFSIKGFAVIQGLLVFYAILLPCIMLLLKNMAIEEITVYLVFFTFTLMGGIIVGLQYGYATRIQQNDVKSIAAITYSADLFGSAIGALLTSLVLLPMMGIINLGFILIGINLLALTRLLIKIKRTI